MALPSQIRVVEQASKLPLFGAAASASASAREY